MLSKNRHVSGLDAFQRRCETYVKKINKELEPRERKLKDMEAEFLRLSVKYGTESCRAICSGMLKGQSQCMTPRSACTDDP